MGTQPSRGPNRSPPPAMLPTLHAWQHQQDCISYVLHVPMASSAADCRCRRQRRCAWLGTQEKKSPLPPSQASWRGLTRIDRASPVTAGSLDELCHTRQPHQNTDVHFVETALRSELTMPDADVAPVACLGCPRLQMLSPLSGSRCSCPFLYQSSTFAILKPAWKKACSSQFCSGVGSGDQPAAREHARRPGHPPSVLRPVLSVRDLAEQRPLRVANLGRQHGAMNMSPDSRPPERARSVHVSGFVRGVSVVCGCWLWETGSGLAAWAVLAGHSGVGGPFHAIIPGGFQCIT